jgi:hypothetical protein
VILDALTTSIPATAAITQPDVNRSDTERQARVPKTDRPPLSGTA